MPGSKCRALLRVIFDQQSNAIFESLSVPTTISTDDWTTTCARFYTTTTWGHIGLSHFNFAICILITVSVFLAVIETERPIREAYPDLFLLSERILFALELGNDRSVTAILNLLQNPRSEDPGALTIEQVKADKSQAGKFTEKFNTGQTVDQQVLGLQYQDLSAGPGELYVKTFYMRRNFEQQLPYSGDSRIDYDRDYFGASADYRQSLELAGFPFRYVAGVQARVQRDDRIRQEMSSNGNLEELTADELQTATALSTFAQDDMNLTDELIFPLGGRFDQVRLKVDDDYPRGEDPSGSQSFNEWSGSAGLSYRYLPSHQAYANISTAFETPTFSEFANPSRVGGLNPEVEPQKSLNHELGLRGEFNTGVDYDVALFWIDVRDELIPYELSDPDDTRTFYRNAGDTTRKGFDAAVGWLFSPSWHVDSALSWPVMNLIPTVRTVTAMMGTGYPAFRSKPGVTVCNGTASVVLSACWKLIILAVWSPTMPMTQKLTTTGY